MEICFADFAKALQLALQPPNDDKAVVNHLLGWITNRKTVLDKNGNPVQINCKMKRLSGGSKNYTKNRMVFWDIGR